MPEWLDPLEAGNEQKKRKQQKDIQFYISTKTSPCIILLFFTAVKNNFQMNNCDVFLSFFRSKH